MINDVFFTSDNLKIFGRISIPKEYKSGIVFLHGGGLSNSYRYELLQEEFYKKNVATLAFDFRGCGKSDGNFVDGSLINRKFDSESSLLYFKEQTNLNDKNIYIWGSSMGGYVACNLLNGHLFKGIILQSAAAYGQKAENLKLDSSFTEEITKENNWSDSGAFKAFNDFNGKKIIIYGENDNIIPEDVKDKYKSGLSAGGEYIIIKNAGHTLLNPQNDLEKEALNKLVETVIGIIAKGS